MSNEPADRDLSPNSKILPPPPPVVNEPEELFVLDLDKSYQLDFRPIPVDAALEEPIDPKALSALVSVESSLSTETPKVEESNESSASQGSPVSVEKASTPPKEDAQTGTPIF